MLSGCLAVWQSGSLAGLGPCAFIPAGLALGIVGLFVAILDGGGGNRWVLGLHGQSGGGGARGCGLT